MALERLKRQVARFAPLTRALFGVRVPHPTAQGHWDFSTLVLFAELKGRVAPAMRVLELGTGEAGILSIAMARRVAADFLAVDVASEAVRSATRVAEANHARVEFLQSDLLSGIPVERTFDLTFFNPPYVPRAQSALWRTMGEPARVFDGGEDGLDVIRRFFGEAKGRGASLGTILIGFNRRLVTEAQVEAIARTSGFRRTKTSRASHPGTVLAFGVSN